jgi:hypothetical protein
MKILKEQQIRQDELPITFITSFVSRGWEEVGMLKEQIKALKAEFKNVDKIEEILQGLIDAYLINIGQLELFLHENEYVEVPTIEETSDKKEDEEVSASEEESEEVEPEVKVIEVEAPAEESESEGRVVMQPAPKDFEAFEYFVDFDDPTGDPLTDDDIYDN